MAELDDLFGKLTAANKARGSQAPAKPKDSAALSRKKPSALSKPTKPLECRTKGPPPSDDLGMLSGSGKQDRKTVDGFRMYTEEELKLNLPGSGDTEDCPFDCQCCF